MDDYCKGIAYATGYIARDTRPILFIRNLDPWYAKTVAAQTGVTAYASNYSLERDGRVQWCVKLPHYEMPDFRTVEDPAAFIRAFVEIHGVLDRLYVTSNHNSKRWRLRLRIFGDANVLRWINHFLPAGEKKLQHIKASSGGYVGETSALYYQAKKEIIDIFEWIDGTPKNPAVWDSWDKILKVI